jgi:hypothetical protein
MVLYAYMCYIFVFSLHRKFPNMILEDKLLIFRRFCHIEHANKESIIRGLGVGVTNNQSDGQG